MRVAQVGVAIAGGRHEASSVGGGVGEVKRCPRRPGRRRVAGATPIAGRRAARGARKRANRPERALPRRPCRV